MGWRYEQLGKGISTRLSELFRESRTSIVDPQAEAACSLLGAPKLPEDLDSYIRRARGVQGRSGGSRISKDALSTLSKALYPFPSGN